MILKGNHLASILMFFSVYWWIAPLLIAFRIGTFRNFGLYHWAWQYMSVHEVVSLIKAIITSSLLTLLSIIAFGNKDFPFSVIIIEALFCFSFIGGIRLSIRLWKESQPNIDSSREEKRALIVGAGDAGEMILREMLKIPQMKYKPVGFIDDDPTKNNILIHHLPVLGKCDDIPIIVEKYEIDEIILAIPTASSKQIRRIVSLCEESRAKFRIVPGIFELIDGTVHVNQIRNVEIEDLLGREPINLDMKSISSYISDANILITGAGGSIGAELCRQVAMYNPSKLVLLGKGENSIYDIQLELKEKFPFLTFSTYIADVRDFDRINNIFKETKPDVVFHAAANKHVFLMENNPEEAVLNNIIGTKNVVDIAENNNVKKFVMISTDKAVHPSSIMGATKRAAEMIVQLKTMSGSSTKFVSVRFGNVLGSRGSVVPLFKKQIASGGPVTITHPEATRYFMTIPEAVQLVIQAGAMGNGGEIFVLDMGQPVKIIDLAKDLIRLSGFEVGVDIEIKYVGLKPGEKLFEEILTSEEGMKTTKHEKIFITPPSKINIDALMANIGILEKMAHDGQRDEIKKKLREIAD
ncbi:polysaccharide biosynthesis protein [Candidatus Saganbacteria bacterium]|nr:polysaccharide biosynthesis protein [Candidatus Saganbacteria bacterium]